MFIPSTELKLPVIFRGFFCKQNKTVCGTNNIYLDYVVTYPPSKVCERVRVALGSASAGRICKNCRPSPAEPASTLCPPASRE